MLERVKYLFNRYERYVSPITLVTGFIFDNLTLQRIDVLYSNALLIGYLFISGMSIIILNIHETKRKDEERSETFRMTFILILQFCFGGLFSAAFLFYSKSGTLIASWPFLLIIFSYVIGNELMRKNYVRLGFQIIVLFMALFSYLIFFFPIVLERMGDEIFILSGIASIMLIGMFCYVVSWFSPDRMRRSAPFVTLSVIALFVLINVLYFTNLIPPIPLSLKNAGIYRSIDRLPDGTYEVVGEKQRWFDSLLRRSTVRAVFGEPLYAYSSVFAPTNLSINVYHIWQYYDEEEERWIGSTRIPLAIVGGRDSGFRTYSVKEYIFPGKWRVNVETPRGQLIGRLSFTVKQSAGDEEVIRDVK